MIHPDQEIYEVEKRIAERRHRVETTARQTGRATLRALTSPVALVGAAVVGFLIAGGWERKQRSKPERHMSYSDKKAAKASVWSGLGMTALTWFIKSQFGGPVDMAKFFVGKIRSRKQPSPAVTPAMMTSPRGDRVPATTRK
jgi:hypothetical protein